MGLGLGLGFGSALSLRLLSTLSSITGSSTCIFSPSEWTRSRGMILNQAPSPAFPSSITRRPSLFSSALSLVTTMNLCDVSCCSCTTMP